MVDRIVGIVAAREVAREVTAVIAVGAVGVIEAVAAAELVYAVALDVVIGVRRSTAASEAGRFAIDRAPG